MSLLREFKRESAGVLSIAMALILAQHNIQSRVLATDIVEMLPLICGNLALNSVGNTVSAQLLDWADPPQQACDVLLLSDCIYSESAFSMLVWFA